MLQRFILFFSLILLLIPSAKPTHIVGGEMYYKCLGNNNYEIILKLYRDCFNGGPPLDNPARVFLFDSSGSVFQFLAITPTISQVPNNPIGSCYSIPPNVCVQEGIYDTIINIPSIPLGGLTITYQRCCRNVTIENLLDPGSQGATYTEFIPDNNFVCNSSPVFKNFPPIIICANDTFNFDHSAIDPDGDSLVYELCEALQGGDNINPTPIPNLPPPYSSVVYSAGFSSSNPIPANPALAIDPSTGILTAVPTQIGQYVVAICVREYRNDSLISIHRREFQFNVASCDYSTKANFNFPLPVCLNQTVNYTDQSTDNNGSIVNWKWLYNDTSLVDTIQNPARIYNNPGSYSTTLIVTSDLGCTDTITKTFIIKSPPQVSTSSDTIICKGDSISIAATGGESYEWFPNDYILNKDSSNAVVFPLVTTVYTVIIFNECQTDTGFVKISIADEITINPSPDSIIILKGDVVTLTSGVIGTSLITWSSTINDIDLNQINLDEITVSPGRSAIYYITATNDYGCRGIDSITVEVINIAIPNIFSPNSDGLNDYFKILTTVDDLENANLKIYNRWGELIYESSEPNITGFSGSTIGGWDGTYRNKDQPNGSYTYIFTFQLGEKGIIRSGNVTLIR